MCLQPCINRDAPPLPGSSNPEPAIPERAISQSICSSKYGGLRARRRGGARVRREITVIREGEADMLDMRDEASVRTASYEGMRPTNNMYRIITWVPQWRMPNCAASVPTWSQARQNTEQ